MARMMLIGVMLTLLSGCSNKMADLKSPCVGADGSPCVRRAVNQDMG